MKKLFLILALLPLSLAAQQHHDMNMGDQGEMKKMMAAMQKMQTCMMKINKDDLAKIQAKAAKMQLETQALCSKGNRDQAQQNAKDAFNDFKNDPTATELRKCTAILENLASEHETDEIHVCDTANDGFSQ